MRAFHQSEVHRRLAAALHALDPTRHEPSPPAFVVPRSLWVAAGWRVSDLSSLKTAADQVTRLTNPQSPLFNNLNRASEELAGAALAVEKLSREGSPTVVGLYEMLQEVSRAAHATRMLVESLEQQPQSIFWGKPDPDGNR